MMVRKHHAAWCTCPRCNHPMPADSDITARSVLLGLAIGAAIAAVPWALHAFPLSFFGL